MAWEDELEEEEDEEDDRELLERELLELEEDLVPLLPSKTFFSFNRTFFALGDSSSSFRVITLMIFSAAFKPICTSISSFSMAGPEAAKIH